MHLQLFQLFSPGQYISPLRFPEQYRFVQIQVLPVVQDPFHVQLQPGFVFSGGTAGEELLINALNWQLAIEVEVAEPFKGVELLGTSLASKQENGLSEWAVAVGLCLKGIQVTA